jgi:hypothetical protein
MLHQMTKDVFTSLLYCGYFGFTALPFNSGKAGYGYGNGNYYWIGGCLGPTVILNITQ